MQHDQSISHSIFLRILLWRFESRKREFNVICSFLQWLKSLLSSFSSFRQVSLIKWVLQLFNDLSSLLILRSSLLFKVPELFTKIFVLLRRRLVWSELGDCELAFFQGSSFIWVLVHNKDIRLKRRPSTEDRWSAFYCWKHIMCYSILKLLLFEFNFHQFKFWTVIKFVLRFLVITWISFGLSNLLWILIFNLNTVILVHRGWR